jgi:flagellar protein FliS
MTATLTASAAADQYLRTQVRASTPLERTVLLYAAALRFTATARDAMARRDIPARRTALSKALAVVDELQATLNMTDGGVIAEELDRLYGWIRSRLLDAIAQQKPQPIDEARRILETLHDAWQTIAAGAGPAGARP